MSVLEKIVRSKRIEIESMRKNTPVALLEKSKYFQRETLSLERSLLDKGKHGIIAEFKRKSPSRGVINNGVTPENVCPRYMSSGASAVSVLTNGEFFGGSNEDLARARKLCNGPILRKEFIIDEYQVVESKSIGADAILLIADILSGVEVKRLSALAESLKMEVLYEIHDKNGIEKLPPGSRLTGINSRNLGNFSIDMNILNRTISMLPPDSIKIAESGIHSVETVTKLKTMGFTGFLIGELFMKEKDPGEACNKFINDLKHLNYLKQD
jgi:indole-3-glycerol phosphate synthase